MIPLEDLPWSGHVGKMRAFNTLRGEVDPNNPYSQFNLCDYRHDNPERVAVTRRNLCSQLGIEPQNLIIPVQTHSTTVLQVGADFLLAQSDARRELLQGVDALVTNVPGVCIGVNTADCVPTVLFDPVARVIGVAHGGWKGTAARIVAATLHSMCALGAEPNRVLASMGPSICQDCFEVGDEVVVCFAKAGFNIGAIMKRNPLTGKAHISLQAATALTLEHEGVPAAHIVDSHRCTRCNPNRYFSARRLGVDSGRVFTAALLLQ